MTQRYHERKERLMASIQKHKKIAMPQKKQWWEFFKSRSEPDPKAEKARKKILQLEAAMAELERTRYVMPRPGDVHINL